MTNREKLIGMLSGNDEIPEADNGYLYKSFSCPYKCKDLRALCLDEPRTTKKVCTSCIKEWLKREAE